MFGVISCLVAIVLALVAFKYFQYQQLVKKVALPGPKPIPFFGNVHELFGKPSLWLASLDWIYKYGDVIQIFILNSRFVIIANDEEALKELFVNKIFTKGELGSALEDTSGKTGLVFSEGESWSRVRRTCNGAFNIQHLQLFINPIYSCIEVLNKKLEENLSTVDKIKTIEMDSIFMLTTLDVIASTMFTVDLQSLAKGESELSKNVEIYITEAFKIMLNPLHNLNPFCTMKKKKSAAFMVTFVENIIHQRIQERNNKSSTAETKDLLDLLLDANDPDTGVGLTKEELRDQVMTFLVAGHETTAHTLTFTIAQIARHPHVADLVHSEIEKVIGTNGRITYEDIAKLHYLTAVIKETLRMFPIAPAIVRELSEDKVIAGCNIPKGSIIGANIIAMQYNPKIWKNPTIFDPSRFLRNESIPEYRPPSYTFAPFGHGRRSCIGQHFAMLEMKLILASILHKFRFELLPMESVSPIQHLTFRPQGGLHVTIWNKNE